MDGLNLFWSKDRDKVYRRNYTYLGPGLTYKITTRNKEEEAEEGNSGYINLDPDATYILGLDMSTSQSGVAIFNSKMNLISMIDIVNSGLKADELYTHLRAFFKTNFNGLHFSHVIIEEQFKAEGGKMVFGKLSELQGTMLGMCGIFGIHMQRIKPSVWRKHFLASSRYDGRRKSKIDAKIAAREETNFRYNMTMYTRLMESFSKADQAHICDSCDAVGVACGFMQEVYHADAPTRLEFISNIMPREDRHMSTVHIETMDVDTKKIRVNGIDGIDRYDTIQSAYHGLISARGFKLLGYNKDMRLDENVCRATSGTNKVCVLLVTDEYVNQQLTWESNKRLEDNETFVVICYRDNIRPNLDAPVRTELEL